MLGQAPMFPIRDAGQGNFLHITFFAMAPGFSSPSFFRSSSCKNKSNYLFLYRSQVTCFNQKKKMARNLENELFTSHFHFHFFSMMSTISKYCLQNMSYQGVSKARFSENLAFFVFLFPFVLSVGFLSYYQRHGSSKDHLKNS